MNRFVHYVLAAALVVGGACGAQAQGNPGFTAFNPGTPISATTGGVTGNLPAGPAVVATNVGATNAVYCQIGPTASTSSQYIASGSWFEFQIPPNQSKITCITATSTTTVNLVGGVGQASGSGGGGGGGGGGGNVTVVGPLGSQVPASSISTVGPTSAPAAGAASAIVTGGTAVTLVTGPVNGCYVTNPLSASDQNISTAEVAQLNPVTTATANGRGTNSTLQPGQSFSCPFGMTTSLSAIAATTAHAFNVVKW